MPDSLIQRLSARKAEYLTYLKSERWSELRAARWEIDNHECVLCAAKAQTAHHRRYPEVFGQETTQDLVSLCLKCHRNFHFPPSAVELQKEISEKASEPSGTTCPVCQQYVKRYKRKLNSGMAFCLISMIKMTNAVEFAGGWFHATKDLAHHNHLNANSVEYTKLKFWGLTEQRPNPKDSTKKDSGYWRVTPLGREFALGRATVPRHVIVFNNRVEDFSEEMVTIKDALGDAFDYDQLMKEPL